MRAVRRNPLHAPLSASDGLEAHIAAPWCSDSAPQSIPTPRHSPMFLYRVPQLFFPKLTLFVYFILFGEQMCHSTCAETRGQLVAASPTSPCGSQRSNTGCQAWLQASLPLCHFASLELCFFIRTHFYGIRVKPRDFIFN